MNIVFQHSANMDEISLKMPCGGHIYEFKQSIIKKLVIKASALYLMCENTHQISYIQYSGITGAHINISNIILM